MKKTNRAKLYLSQETIRALGTSDLNRAVGASGGCFTKPQFCQTTANPECATNVEGVCRSLDCGNTFGCPPITNTCPPSEVC